MAISIPEASSVIIECEIDNKHIFRDSESMTRSASDCNSENKLIGNNEIAKSENDRSYDTARNYNSTKADAAECIEAENNNIETRDKIKIKNNKFLRPLWSIKRKQKHVNALNTIVGEELDISDVDTTVNDVTSTNTNDNSGNKRINTSSSTNFPRKSPSTKLKRREEHG